MLMRTSAQGSIPAPGTNDAFQRRRSVLDPRTGLAEVGTVDSRKRAGFDSGSAPSFLKPWLGAETLSYL